MRDLHAMFHPRSVAIVGASPDPRKVRGMAVAALIGRGLELGDAMDRLTGMRDVKHGAGASGILTGGLVDRQAAYESIVTYALAPWLAGEHWA